MKQVLLFVFVVTTLSFGCNKFDQAEIDRDLILQYLKVHNLTAEEDGSGLFYIIDVPGGSEKPTTNDDVTVTYRGELRDGTLFDKTPDGDNATFPLSDVIQGWQIGIPKFGRGGSGKLLVPSTLGYGSRQVGIIPANSVLVFDVSLVHF